MYQIDPCECSYGIEVARFADDSVDLGHGRQFLPILRDSGYHLDRSLGLPQVGNKGNGIREEGIDHQNVNRKLVLLDQRHGIACTLCGYGVVTRGVQRVAQPEDETEVRIDEKNRGLFFLSRFPSISS